MVTKEELGERQDSVLASIESLTKNIDLCLQHARASASSDVLGEAVDHAIVGVRKLSEIARDAVVTATATSISNLDAIELLARYPKEKMQ